MLDQDGADPIAGRIPGREHANRAVAKPVEGIGQRTERLRPGDVLALFSRPQQIEVALPADQHPRLLDHQARRGRQSFRAVVTHTHHCEPVLHCGQRSGHSIGSRRAHGAGAPEAAARSDIGSVKSELHRRRTISCHGPGPG